MATQLYAHQSISKISFDYRNTLTGRSAVDKGAHTVTKTYTEGAGANQAQLVYHAEDVAVAATVRDQIDLSGTDIQTAFGANIALTEIKELMLQNTGTVPLTVGGGTDGIGDSAVPIFGAVASTVVVPAGDVLHMTFSGANGIAVTATTADILAVYNPHATIAGEYAVTVIGN